MRQWTVQDVMTTDVVFVLVDTPYGEIVAALACNGISAVPVLDGFRRVVGVVSEADLLHKVEFTGDTEQRIFEWGTRKAGRTKSRGDTAQELMTSPAVTVLPGVSIVVAAKRMDSEHVKRLPVVNELGRLIGIASRRDLLSMYLRPDHELRNEVANGVVGRLWWADPLTVDVTVVDGIVTLTGRVDRRSTAQIAVGVTISVPGVISVVDRLDWTYDDTRVAAAVGV